MSISVEQRQKLIKMLADKLAKASGYATNVNDVAQWDVAADAIIKVVEGIVDQALANLDARQTEPESHPKEYDDLKGTTVGSEKR